jgi:hypothetical protein
VENCLEERFAEPVDGFKLVHPRQGSDPYLIPADDNCLEGDPLACKNRKPLDRTRRWFGGSEAGNWVCVTDGNNFGWTLRSEIERTPIAQVPAREWIGRWRRKYGGASIRIRPG